MRKQHDKLVYDWSSIDSLLEQIASRGHQAIIRFRYEYPNNTDVDSTKGSTAVPAYIKNLSDYEETYHDVEGDGPTYYADWRNTELQWFTKQFYSDFATRYTTPTSELHFFRSDSVIGQNIIFTEPS